MASAPASGCGHSASSVTAMRVLVPGCAACACERSWNTYDYWMHSKKRNLLSLTRADQLVCRTPICTSHYDYGSTYGSLAWDEEMVCDDPRSLRHARSLRGRSPDPSRVSWARLTMTQ